MKKKNNIELAVGPMSQEIIESVFRFSERTDTKLMLIASKNQIDYSGGYVNNWTTKEYMDFIKTLQKKYPKSKVDICRDHCGPGFNGIDDLSDAYKTLEDDIKNGFDLIHIDFCHYKGSKEEQLKESKKAVLRCLELNPDIKIEIGTDENTGSVYTDQDLLEIESDIDFFKQFCNPEYYVVQTGSLVMEINQVGSYNDEFIKKISDLLVKKGLKLKEHNADYLPIEEIEKRKGVVHAQNIAPQLGVVQTKIILSKCLVYGIKMDDFIKEVYQGKKWEKWMHDNDASDKMLCVLIAGHYHFASKAYQDLVKEIEKRENITETIINQMEDLIGHYVFA